MVQSCEMDIIKYIQPQDEFDHAALTEVINRRFSQTTLITSLSFSTHVTVFVIIIKNETPLSQEKHLTLKPNLANVCFWSAVCLLSLFMEFEAIHNHPFILIPQ